MSFSKQADLSISKKSVQDIALLSAGVVLLSALAQISIPLPWTPVPITGQTFGVAVLSLGLGRRLGFASVVTYVFLGGLGAPIFANGKFGLSLGPTLGYLVGMMLASLVMGSLSDRAWNRSFWKCYLACILGSVCTFGLGLFGLSFFVPKASLLSAGLWPFLPGDLIKSLLASGLVSSLARLKSA